MSVQVHGCNHVAIEVDDIEKAVAFYQDVFNLEKLDEGEGDAFFKLGEHQFLAMFEVHGARRKATRRIARQAHEKIWHRADPAVPMRLPQPIRQSHPSRRSPRRVARVASCRLAKCRKK